MTKKKITDRRTITDGQWYQITATRLTDNGTTDETIHNATQQYDVRLNNCMTN